MQVGGSDPTFDRLPRQLRDLKLDGAFGLLLHDHRPRSDLVSMGHVEHPKFDEIASS